MLKLHLVPLLLLLTARLAWSASVGVAADDEGVTNYNSRDPRFFFHIISISPESCTTLSTTTTTGTCYSSKDCATLGGTASGTCAFGFGVCCIVTFTRTCSQTISATTPTNFINSESPSAATTQQTCTATIDIQNQNICQVRLDYVDFEVLGPNPNGVCDEDFISFNGFRQVSQTSDICGFNTGQHMYLNVDPTGNNPTVTVDISTAAGSRTWDILVTSIPCDSTDLAPVGCLQYFTEAAGIVSSFNFVPTTITELDNAAATGQHLANQNYAVCIAPQENRCIRWTEADEPSFILHDDAQVNSPLISARDPLAVYNAFDALGNGPCTDYVIIPNAFNDGVPQDRYCGLILSPGQVTSSSTFHRLEFVTDGVESPTPFIDSQNIGFSLAYRIMSC